MVRTCFTPSKTSIYQLFHGFGANFVHKIIKNRFVKDSLTNLGHVALGLIRKALAAQRELEGAEW